MKQVGALAATRPPRQAQQLVDVAPQVLEHLRTGGSYFDWNPAERFAYIRRAVELVTGIEKFAIPANIGRSRATWSDAVQWWLRLADLPITPTVTQVPQWHDFLQKQVRYRFTWGLGAVLAIALEESDSEEVDWQAAGILWAAVWVKDLLV
jgi:hypothetical protein